MITLYDHFGQPEYPYMILCTPNKTQLFSLGLSYDIKMTLRYNAIGELEFTFPKTIDDGENVFEAYEYVKNKKLVLVENYGYFVIEDVQEEMNGSQPVKKVTCKSGEFELVSKRISAYGGTVKLYDDFNPEDTLLGDILVNAPNWSVGSIDAVLLTKYRTFDVSDTNIYNFLSVEVSKAFECVFIFDNINKTISALAQENATLESDIFLSFDNLIDNATLSEKTDEITTCLSVYGGNDLDIRDINPLGTNKIYDFSYYMTTEWMTQELITAIYFWRATVINQMDNYTPLLETLKTYNGELIVLQSDLATLNAEFMALEQTQKVRIEGGLAYGDLLPQMTLKKAAIANQEILIANKQSQINSVKVDLQVIHNICSFEFNFTEDQLKELNNFIYENTYKNDNIIKTDSMTAVEIQEAKTDLYEQAVKVLSRVSQPRYELNFESINYLNLPEFFQFSQDTQLGSVFIIELSETQLVESVLLEMSMTFDDPNSFTMTFSNRLRLDNGSFMYSDLFGKVVETGSKVSFDNLKWSDWERTYKDDVTQFITSSLNTANNEIINNANQEILINQNGLRGRTFNPNTQQYDPTQVWLTSSVLAFTDNSFTTSKLALGKITVNGINKFGLIADVIVGRLLAGNSLTIANENNNFILDASGAYLNNAKFTIATTNTKIIIDPTATNSFVIQKNEGGTFNNKFWVDNTGNVNLSGTITATAGNIGTLVIDSNGLRTSNGVNYLRGNGDMKWGALTITGSSSTFSGSLSGASGTFSGALNGATGTFSGALVAATGSFTGSITATSGFLGNVNSGWAIGAGGIFTTGTSGAHLTLLNNGAGIDVALGQLVVVYNGTTKYMRYDGVSAQINSTSDTRVSGSTIHLQANSSLWINDSQGFSGVLDPNAISYMSFVHGILVDFG